MDKNVQINILPQDPGCWLAIAIGAVLCVMLLGAPKLDTAPEVLVEREKTKRLEMLIEAGHTNAITEAVKADFPEKFTKESP